MRQEINNKEKFIMSLIESTNICYRQMAVEQKMDLVSLEQWLLSQEEIHRYIYDFAYEKLKSQNIGVI